MKLVFATNNPNKLHEVRKLLSCQGIEILSLSDINCNEEIEEPFETLEENAMVKAKHIKNNYGYDCFADDTGLEIDSLEGRPGVYSARYAGDNCTPQDNINKVLKELKGIDSRNANFRTVIALILNGKEYYFSGEVFGEILKEESGHKGFGYDPIFMPEGFSISFAEMDMEQKNAISHRGRAVKKLIEFLISQ